MSPIARVLVQAGTPALVLLALAAATLTCGGERADGGDAVVRDSAGVQVIESALSSAVPTFVPGEPALVVGESDGAPEEQLFRVRNPFLLEDGRLVIPNGGSSEVRIYSADGSLERALGRRGDGPGEHRSVTWARPYRGDSLVVWDGQASRLTIVPVEGGEVRTLVLGRDERPAGPSLGGVSIGAPGSASRRVSAYDVFSDGSFLGRIGEVSASSGDSTKVRRDVFAYVHFSAEGERVSEVGSFPDDGQFVWADPSSVSVRPRAFGKVTGVVVASGRIHVADNSEFGIRSYTPAGELRRIVRVTAETEPVTEADQDRWIERELAAMTNPLFRQIAERAVRDMDFPETVPFHGRLIAARDGTLWLERYRKPWDEGEEWIVFGTEGAVERRVLLPAGHRLTDPGRDRIVAVLTDELDVERVAILPLRRQEPSRNE